jgi:hypothetical protein
VDSSTVFSQAPSIKDSGAEGEISLRSVGGTGGKRATKIA